jgi:hypothetical protein
MKKNIHGVLLLALLTPLTLHAAQQIDTEQSHKPTFIGANLTSATAQEFSQPDSVFDPGIADAIFISAQTLSCDRLTVVSMGVTAASLLTFLWLCGG